MYATPIPPSNTSPPTTLSRRARPYALIAWMVVATLAAITFVRGIELLLSAELDLGRIAQESPRFLGPAERVALLQMGLSVDAFRSLNAGLDIVFVVAYTSIAFVLVWRKRGDWMALLVSGALIVYGASTAFSLQSLVAHPDGADIGTRLVNLLSTLCVPILAYLFPNGRFVPRWTRAVAIGWAILAIATALIPGWDIGGWPWIPLTVLYAVGLSTSIVAQVFRYRRVSDAAQRQQTKWVLLAFILAAGLYFALPLLSFVFPAWLERGRNLLVYEMAFTVVFYVSQLAVPIGLLFSILRYRLWDVDLFINRTIVYGAVTGILFFVFESISFLFDTALGALVGQATVVTNLIPALFTGVIFSPVRDKTQNFVDRRFYREKVDARKAFGEFGRALRRTVDLNEALQLIVTRVSGHMHASHAAIYLRNDAGAFTRASATGPTPVTANAWQSDPQILDLLMAGLIAPGNARTYPLLVPLTLPPVADLDGVKDTLLVGVLALGPRLSELGYSSEDQTLLLGLADQAGTALYIGQLVREKA